MSAKYKLTENPPASAKNGIQNLHARIVPSRTATIDDLAAEISTISTFSSGDIKGLLESFTQVVTNRLKNGENVNLDGLGYYSVSLALEYYTNLCISWCSRFCLFLCT